MISLQNPLLIIVLITQKVIIYTENTVLNMVVTLITLAQTHPSGVVQDLGVRPAVVGRVGVGVVAQSGQHGGDDSHVPHHVSWDLPHPLGQGLHVDGLDDLICGPLHPGKTERCSACI